jgi:hypothetical protein
MLNSQILQAAKPEFQWNATQDWTEPYAESFGFQAYYNTLPPSLYYHYTADGIMANGYFICTLDWAAAVLSNGVTPPSPTPAPYQGNGFSAYSCNSVPPL